MTQASTRLSMTRKAEGDIAQSRRRLHEVDRVTAAAILLVVVGHVVARQPPAGNEWYESLKYLIYQFHMPLFMFLSGLVFYYTYTPVSRAGELAHWSRKKIARLVPGFMLVGSMILVGKVVASQFLHVDNVQSNLAAGVMQLVVMPKSSAAGSLWYIYVLLEFYLLVPLLLLVLGGRLNAVLTIAVAAHALHLAFVLPDLFMIAGVSEYLLYFTLGCLACAYYERFTAVLEKHGPWLVVVFASSFTLTLGLPEMQSKIMIGLASIPACFYLIGLCGGRFQPFLGFVSAYTFTIYLFNTIAIGVTKGVMLKFFSWDGVNFLVYFPILTLAGVVGPILAYRLILSKNRWLARVMN